MAGRIEFYEEDRIIITEGKPNDKMFLVLEGAVALYINYGMENEYVLGVKGKNKIFGEMSMLAEENSLYTAVAFSDAKVAWFQAGNLDQFLNGYPGCAVDFLKNIAKNNSVLQKSFSMMLEEIRELSGQPADEEEIKKASAKIASNTASEYVKPERFNRTPKMRFLDSKPGEAAQ